jgi:hypothetical protein
MTPFLVGAAIGAAMGLVYLWIYRDRVKAGWYELLGIERSHDDGLGAEPVESHPGTDERSHERPPRWLVLSVCIVAVIGSATVAAISDDAVARLATIVAGSMGLLGVLLLAFGRWWR